MTTASVRVLVVDNELRAQRLLRGTLEPRGYEVLMARTAHAALSAITTLHPDLMLLDPNLPDVDGIDLIVRLRTWSRTPVIVLSMRNAERDKVAALQAGADDYLTKPFGASELVARMQVALRHVARSQPLLGPVVDTGDLAVDVTRNHVTRHGAQVHLTPTEYELLRMLVTSGGQVLTHATLLRAVWGLNSEQGTNKLRVFVNQLRRKIEDDPARPRYVLTEVGVGYRFGEVAGMREA
jgi:two-component system KDP operon response regulator KdpE